LKQVDQKELLAILGHEIGHWKLWHSIQGFVVTHAHTFAMLLAYSYAQHRMGLFTAFGFSWDNASKVPVFVSLFLFAQVFWSPVEKVLVFLMNCNSRHNEFQADRFASVNLGMGVELASGLVKITIENLGASTMLPDPLYSSYHFSHPPLVERLRAINSSNKDNASSSKKTE
jgi:STE24 endopeptidase